MKLNHLQFTQALLLLQSIGSSPSDAFQIPISRKILSPSWTRSSSSSTTTTADNRRLPSVKKQVVAPRVDLLWSKLSQYRFGIGSIPRQLLTKSKQQVIANPKNKDNQNSNSKEILALVTTCCLSILLRPTSAHAAPTLRTAAAISSIFLDGPFDELEGLGILPQNALPGMYFLGFVLRKLVVSVGCLLLATSLARSAVDRIEYWAVLGDKYSRLFNDDEEEEASNAKGESSKVLPNPSMEFNWAVLGGNMEETEGVTIKKDAKEWNKAKHVDWDEYSHTLLSSSPNEKEKKISQAFVKTLAKETQEQEEALIHEAQRYFQEQKNKLHQSEEHEVFGYYVPKSDSLEDYSHKTSSWREYKRELDKTKVKQDVVENATRKEVSERMNIMKNLLTWDDYKHLVGELQKSKEEVKELKQEVEHLNSLMHIEQSIHQAVATTSSDNRLQEMHEDVVVAIPSPSAEHQRRHKTRNELSDLEEKAEYYEQTLKESTSSFSAMECGQYDGEEVTVQDDLGSGIK